MRVKRVNRYYCDYCKKSGCSGGHMKKHEKRCMHNPDRECGFCLAEGKRGKADLAPLVAMLPDPAKFSKPGRDWDGREIEDCPQWNMDFDAAVKAALPALFEAADGCPGCILAAMIQRGTPTTTRSGWNFKEASVEFWRQINEEQQGGEY